MGVGVIILGFPPAVRPIHVRDLLRITWSGTIRSNDSLSGCFLVKNVLEQQWGRTQVVHGEKFEMVM